MGRLAMGFAVATGAAVVVGRMARRWLRLRKARHLVKEFEEGCATSVGRLRRLVDDMVVSMQRGLDDQGSRMMVPNLLHVLPDGTEDGIYYTLHLDARSLDSMSCRAVRIELVNRDFQPVGLTSVKSTEEKMIPRDVLTGTSENFFDFIARELQEFVQNMGNDSNLGMKLGFAWPFTIKRVSHSAGRLFDVPNVFALGDVSKDVSTSLKEAMARIGLNMRVAALVCFQKSLFATVHWIICATSVGRLRRLVEDMVVSMQTGLDDEGSRMMVPLHVLPMDARSLDSMSCRAVRIELVNRDFQPVGLTSVKSTEEKMIPRNVLTGTSENFFDFIAQELQKFVQNMGNDSNLGMKLGFAWPFTIKRVSHSAGRLFEEPNIFALGDVSKDVSTSLKEAMARIGLNMRVAALVNHPEGTLALGHYDDTDTVAAVQIGTGTKACYIEQIGAIRQWRDILNNSEMVVNMEWGNFWSSHLPRTTYDIASSEDENTRQNDQSFSKLISEMYLGEIVRRVLYRIANELGIFGGSTHRLSIPFTLRTSLMVDMHMDDSVDLHIVGNILQREFQLSCTCLKVRKFVVRVCDSAIRRAARLVAVEIAAIVMKIGRGGSSTSSGSISKRMVIAFRKGLYADYATFIKYIDEAIEEILGKVVAQDIFLCRICEDGTGIGSAMLAAVHPG